VLQGRLGRSDSSKIGHLGEVRAIGSRAWSKLETFVCASWDLRSYIPGASL